MQVDEKTPRTKASETRAANQEKARTEARKQKILVAREDAAQLLGGCSTRTLLRMEKRGLLKAVRLTPGGMVYYRMRDLEALAHG
jgi:hypothetical protein